MTTSPLHRQSSWWVFAALGVGAGAGCTTDEDPAAHDADVIVIGAGMAGLVAADRLAEEGLDVLLLEKEDQVGGKLLSVPLGGSNANMGAQYLFYGSNARMNGYLDRVASFEPSGGGGVVWGGAYMSWEALPLSLGATQDLLRAEAQMAEDHAAIREGREFFFDEEPASEDWSRVEQESAEDYLSGYHPDVDRLYGLFLAPEGGGSTEDISALLLVGWYADVGTAEGSIHLIEGGNQRYAELIHEDFRSSGGRTLLSSEVAAVAESETGVQVSAADGQTFDAEFAVVATPAWVSREIVQGLSASRLEALDAVEYGPMVQVALHLGCLPTGEKLAGVSVEDGDISGFIDQVGPSDELGEDETVISVVVAGDAGALELDDQELVERVGVSLQGIDPEFDPQSCVMDSAVQRWPSGIPSFTPGFLSQHQDTLRRAHGSIYFAGDYTHDPSLDGTAWSGVRAAEQILAQRGD